MRKRELGLDELGDVDELFPCLPNHQLAAKGELASEFQAEMERVEMERRREKEEEERKSREEMERLIEEDERIKVERRREREEEERQSEEKLAKMREEEKEQHLRLSKEAKSTPERGWEQALQDLTNSAKRKGDTPSVLEMFERMPRVKRRSQQEKHLKEEAEDLQNTEMFSDDFIKRQRLIQRRLEVERKDFEIAKELEKQLTQPHKPGTSSSSHDGTTSSSHRSKSENPDHGSKIGLNSKKTDLFQLIRERVASTNLKLQQASKEHLDDPSFLKEIKSISNALDVFSSSTGSNDLDWRQEKGNGEVQKTLENSEIGSISSSQDNESTVEGFPPACKNITDDELLELWKVKPNLKRKNSPPKMPPTPEPIPPPSSQSPFIPHKAQPLQNLMTPILSEGEMMATTAKGFKKVPPENNVDEKPSDYEMSLMARKMRAKVKWTCNTCGKFFQKELEAKKHGTMGQVELLGNRNRMKFPGMLKCVVKKERMFSEKEIHARTGFGFVSIESKEQCCGYEGANGQISTTTGHPRSLVPSQVDLDSQIEDDETDPCINRAKKTQDLNMDPKSSTALVSSVDESDISSSSAAVPFSEMRNHHKSETNEDTAQNVVAAKLWENNLACPRLSSKSNDQHLKSRTSPVPCSSKDITVEITPDAEFESENTRKCVEKDDNPLPRQPGCSNSPGSCSSIELNTEIMEFKAEAKRKQEEEKRKQEEEKRKQKEEEDHPMLAAPSSSKDFPADPCLENVEEFEADTIEGNNNRLLKQPRCSISPVPCTSKDVKEGFDLDIIRELEAEERRRQEEEDALLAKRLQEESDKESFLFLDKKKSTPTRQKTTLLKQSSVPLLDGKPSSCGGGH